MGCDIHMVVEKNIGTEDSPRWVPYRMPRSHQNVYAKEPGKRFSSPMALSRNYERFAALAGVRGCGPAARGWPEDINEATRHLLENDGDHTPSWLPLAEAVPIFLATDYYDLSDFDRKYPAYFYFGVEEESDGSLSRFRLVFNFDS